MSKVLGWDPRKQKWTRCTASNPTSCSNHATHQGQTVGLINVEDIQETVDNPYTVETDDSLDYMEAKYQADRNKNGSDNADIYGKEEPDSDATVVNPKLNKAGKIMDTAGRVIIGAGFVGGALSATFLAAGPVGFFVIAMGSALAGVGMSVVGDRMRKKAGASIPPQGKLSDLWKNPDV